MCQCVFARGANEALAYISLRVWEMFFLVFNAGPSEFSKCDIGNKSILVLSIFHSKECWLTDLLMRETGTMSRWMQKVHRLLGRAGLSRPADSEPTSATINTCAAPRSAVELSPPIPPSSHISTPDTIPADSPTSSSTSDILTSSISIPNRRRKMHLSQSSDQARFLRLAFEYSNRSDGDGFMELTEQYEEFALGCKERNDEMLGRVLRMGRG